MHKEQSLIQFQGSELSVCQLDMVSGGFWPFGSGSKPTTNVNINLDVDIIKIEGNNNVVSGRDTWIFNRGR